MDDLLSTEAPTDCTVSEIKDPRLYMAIGGTSLSVISLFCNALIAIVLMRSSHNHFFFFALLAISDTFLSVMYGPVIAMEIIKDVFREVWLNRIYWTYMPSLLTACNISMTFSTFLIILATTERFLITMKSERLRWFRTHRGMLAGCALVLSCLLKGGLFYEFEMVPNADCEGTLSERIIELTALSNTVWYGKVFKFYIRNICTVLFPFIFLIFLNIYIVLTLRKQQRAAALFRFATSRHKIPDTRTETATKLQVRSATRLTVLIVCSFLVSNALNVAFTVVEFTYMELLNDYYEWYEYGTDFVSVMYIFVCATRLLVYVACNEEIRNEVYDFLCGLSAYNRKGFRKQSNNASKGTSEMDSSNPMMIIARRLIGTGDLPETSATKDDEDDASDDPEGGTTNGKLHAVVIANGYTHCATDDV